MLQAVIIDISIISIIHNQFHHIQQVIVSQAINNSNSNSNNNSNTVSTKNENDDNTITQTKQGQLNTKPLNLLTTRTHQFLFQSNWSIQSLTSQYDSYETRVQLNICNIDNIFIYTYKY